jgi:hypothetical protein
MASAHPQWREDLFSHFERASMYQYRFHICKISYRLAAQAVVRIAAGVFLLAVTASPAHAQFRASIQGTVTDPTGAVIPGATLTLTDLATAKVNTTTIDGNGLYNFNALPPDQYSLVVSKGGKKLSIICN